MKNPPTATRKRMNPRILACGALVLLIIFTYYRKYHPVSHSVPQRAAPSYPSIAASDPRPIPNRAHFVYVVANNETDLSFQFAHYLSIYSAWHHWKPSQIYLHTNADEAMLTRARSGSAGKWSQLVLGMPNLIVNHVDPPTHADNGREIVSLEHKSDFVRVEVVHDLGGVYIDWDVYALRDLRHLRESGFAAVGGRQKQSQQARGYLNSGAFLSKAGSRLMRSWKADMHVAYDSGRSTHSDEVLTAIVERLVAEPREMLILEREAFAPGGRDPSDYTYLFAQHDDYPGSHSNLTQGDVLPTYQVDPAQEFPAHWERDPPMRAPEWARDWSCTYLLHAFRPERWSTPLEHYKAITPRHVLERRSNFARALYPVVKEMYERGLVRIDD